MDKTTTLKLNSFNARGLGDGRKRRCVFQWLRQFHKGIIFLQETHGTEALEKKWEKEWGGHIKFSHGTCGNRGVAIMFPKGLDILINNKIKDSNGRFILLDVVLEEQNLTLVNLYAPTKDKEQEQITFINFVQNTLQTYYDANIILGGDLNSYMDPSLDKTGGKKEKISNATKCYQQLCEDYNLADVWRILNPDLRRYTWRGITKNGLVQSRLDIWLTSLHMLYEIHNVDIKPGIKSHHSIIKLEFIIREAQVRGRGFWKFNCSKQRRQYGLFLEKELHKLETDLNNGLPVYGEYVNKKQEFESFNNNIAMGAYIRSRVQFIEEDEKCTKFFLQQEIRNSRTKCIKTLKIGENYVTNPNSILQEEEKFYKTLYSKPSNIATCNANCSLLDQVPSLNANDKSLCDQAITIQECGKSLKELPNNKSPGSDGFTTEFYKFFWPDIKDYVFSSFEYAFQKGMLSLDQRRAILTLLPKPGKDIRLLKNWRPLSLLNTDYKILTKLLASRLQKVLPNIISEDQTGYIKGRYIGENIRTILDIIEYTNHKINPGIILFLDFEKAFDTISWKFLFQTLTSFNFGETFINWIKVIYTNPVSCVSNNGYSSSFFSVTRGIRQGCPISALLFILVAEIMSINVRKNEEIKGLHFNNNIVKLSQLADDTTLFLKDEISVGHVLDLLTHFHECAGLKLNKDKTEAIALGSKDIYDITRRGIKFVKGPVKVLGIWVGKNQEEVICKNFENKMQKLKNLINMWKSRNLSIKGKITLLRTQAMPLILYPCTVLQVPKEKLEEIDQLFYDFIWQNCKHHVKKVVIIQKIEHGGLKMPDIKSMVKAMKLSWVKRLLEKNNNFTNIVKEITQIKNFDTFFQYKNDIQYLDIKVPAFYTQIIEDWYEIYSVLPITATEIWNETIWQNRYILRDNKPILYKHWESHGIAKIKDIVGEDGSFKNITELENESGIKINTMMYNGLKSAIPKAWLKKLKNNPQINVLDKQNVLTIKINNFDKDLPEVKCRDLYWEYVSKKAVSPTCTAKWEELYYFVDFNWEQIFCLPYIVARETKFQSLQYQIVNRYIPTKQFLKICNKSDTDECVHCHKIDDLEHYFYSCKRVVPLWNNLSQLFSNIFETRIVLHSPDIIFGIPNVNNDDLLHSLNFCILFGKYTIYVSKIQDQMLDYNIYIKLLKDRLKSEQYILESLEKQDLFNRLWKKILDNILNH